METMNTVLEEITSVLWHDAVLYVVLGVGVLFTIWSGFSQYYALTHGTKVIRGKYDDKNDPGAINHFQALSAALSATVGLGNIGGVALAVALGGPGAVFWMWVVGVLGMAIKTTEVTLSMLYRNTDDPENPHGGPMFVAKKAFSAMGLSWLGSLIGCIFVITLLISTITGGNMFQAWNVGNITQRYFEIPSVASGIVLAVLVGLVIIGGIKRIGAFAGRVVPLMCGLYILAALVVIAMNLQMIPGLLKLIVVEAFSPSSADGAFLGGTAGYALLWGMKRALFSSEAGQGSSPIAHSAAKTDEPVREGIVAGLEPFIDTIVVCTLTALVILATGAWNRGPEAKFVSASPLTVVLASEVAGQLSSAPTLSVANGEISLSEMSAPARMPTKAERIAQSMSNQPLPEWKSSDPVFVLAHSANDPANSFVVSGMIVDASGGKGVRFETTTAPAGITDPVVGSTLYHGGTARWTVEATEGLPQKQPAVKRTSGDWRVNDNAFIIVAGDFNAWTGKNLHRLAADVRLAETDQLNPAVASGDLFLEWRTIGARQMPTLVNGGSDVYVEYPGATLTAHAFDRAIPGLGKYLVTLACWLFALSTMISWSYYGEKGMVFLFGDGGGVIFGYKLAYCAAIIVATLGFITTDLELDLWTGLGTGVMLWANIPIMLMFGAIAMKAYKEYIRRLKSGEIDQTSHGYPKITDVAEGKDVE